VLLPCSGDGAAKVLIKNYVVGDDDLMRARSVCFPLDLLRVTQRRAIVGQPKTWYLDTIGRFPKNSWWGVAGMSSSLSKPRTGITLKIRHAYVKARYINVSGSRACTSNDRPILETVCQVRSARWFWYCFFGAASVSCIPASLQYVENSAEVNWLPASA